MEDEIIIRTDIGMVYEEQLNGIKEQYEKDAHKSHNANKYLAALEELRSEVEFNCILQSIRGYSYDGICKTIIFLTNEIDEDKADSFEDCVNERENSFDEVTDMLHIRNSIFNLITDINEDMNQASSAFDGLFDLFNANKESDKKEDKEDG